MTTNTPDYRYLLSFGSNKGHRRRHCMKGLNLLQKKVTLLQQSSWIISKPLTSKHYDTSDHEDYLNFIVDISTELLPLKLYHLITVIENNVGHSRKRKWLPRELDIDILFWAKNNHVSLNACQFLTFNQSTLCIPHRLFWERDFLVKLAQDELQLRLPKKISATFLPHKKEAK